MRISTHYCALLLHTVNALDGRIIFFIGYAHIKQLVLRAMSEYWSSRSRTSLLDVERDTFHAGVGPDLGSDATAALVDPVMNSVF